MQNKQIKQIGLAIAATLLAGQALAVPVTQADIVTATNNATLQQAWLSGASAPTYNVFAGFALGCDANSLAIFTNHTAAAKPGSLKDYSAYACTRGGVVSVMYHTIKDGSFNAYAPHVPNDVDGDGIVGTTSLERVKNLATATCGTTTTVADASLGYSYPVTINCQKVKPATAPDSAIALPSGGFSDVEAGLWGVDVSAYGTEAPAFVGQVFGVAVTTPLYRAMQVDQGIYADLATANANDAAYSPANAPNITTAQYVAIAAAGGGYQGDWSLLMPNASPADKAKTIYLMRRVATSGTQASSNAYFLKNPCSSGSTGGQLFPATAQASPAFTVTEDSSSSTLKATMSTKGLAGDFAIGVLSLENNLAADGLAARYLKLDGVHPELGDAKARATTLNSGYGFAMEMKSFVANTSVGTFGETVIGEISASLGAPANCADVPRGLFVSPENGACTVGVETHKGTKFGNNCSPFSLFF